MTLVTLLTSHDVLQGILTRFFTIPTEGAYRDLPSTNTSTTGFQIFSLIDLPLPNLQFTWSNIQENASCSKLNRVFVTQEWMDKLPKTNLIGLPRPVSDHFPLLVNSSLHKGGPTPFRFENMWFHHKDSN